jgi:hypothetical protein
MAETSTFSALVDDVIARSQRRDRILDVVGYARSTIRECQVLAFFYQDMLEENLTADAVPFIWSRPVNFRSMLAIQNPDLGNRGEKLWLPERAPGQQVLGETRYVYLSGDAYVIAGATIGETFPIAYFNYGRRFKYYSVADRPAIFDDELETWAYHANYIMTTELQQAGRDLVSNWLLFRWFQTMVEGTLAKIFKAVGDERSRTAFALYKSQQSDILHGERVVYIGDAQRQGR